MNHPSVKGSCASRSTGSMQFGHSVKGRFAPSPTGLMHLGNARTALFNYLFAQAEQGVFLLRIEDTDLERSKEAYELGLQEDLRSLGLNWQEGPGADQGNGPYHQSKRQALYDDYYHRLEVAGLAYPCFCSEGQLKLARKVQATAGKPPRYAGTCRSLTPEMVKEKCEAGLKPTLRFRIPSDEVVSFQDLVRGDQRFSTNDLGDFIIRRANGTSPFMFCSVIDDALMGVTHVFRGEDHLTNTPRQLLILQALGLPQPTYAHISLIVGPDGSPLSKRHGSRGIQELREEGYLPAGLTNYMARLGHYYKDDSLLSLNELAAQFRVEALNKSPAKFNKQQLDFWQKQAIAALSESDFWKWLGNAVQDLVPENQRRLFAETVKPNVQFPSDALKWANVCFGDALALDDAAKKIIEAAGSAYFEAAIEAFKNFPGDLKTMMQSLKDTLNIKGKALYQPLRVTLTGIEHGPELVNLISLMGDHRVRSRLEAAREK